MTISTRALAAGLLLSTSTAAIAQQPSIILPGAPGEAPRVIDEREATALSDTRYSPADVKFMQDMIVHHQQAVDLAALVDARSSSDGVRKIADRIDGSQEDEIEFMRTWLQDRGESTGTTGGNMQHHAGMNHGAMDYSAHHAMMGMATPAQMAELATLKGTEFDRMFLNLMIRHHQGAIDMVRELHRQPGSAYDPVMFEFTNEIVSDQETEIERMNVLLAGLSTDPRVGLAAGFRDAGEAISNLRLVSALPKPTGFFDPANPAQLQPAIEKDDEEAEESGAEEPDAEGATDEREEDEDGDDRFGQRSSLLSFANTDMAFSGDIMVAGSYHGFNAYRLGDDGMPNLVSSVVCPGGQGDVSIVGDLLFMSVQDSRARIDCGLGGVAERVSEERFRGLRIFDISDITRPMQVGQVQTCRGSHTHSVVSVDADRIVVYNSGTSYVRPNEELAGCFETGGDNTALFSIDVIEVPVANPGASRIASSARVFAEDERIAGLWLGGDHGEGTQRTNITDHCHDITVFPAKNIAAGACSGNGIVLDISDPLNPTRIDDVTETGFAYWHSATFNNDGTKVLFTDEWGGGGRPRCQAGDPMEWGANAFYTLNDGKLEFASLYKLPAPQTDKENCVAHNGSIIPVPGRDIFVQAWYQGGLSVIDFTDAANPFEIAYFDRGPVDEDQLITGGYWSAYWYNGRIYATEISRGLDIFALEPSEFLTAEEIAAAEAAQFEGNVFNPQTQTQVTWPDEVVRAAENSRKGG